MRLSPLIIRQLLRLVTLALLGVSATSSWAKIDLGQSPSHTPVRPPPPTGALPDWVLLEGQDEPSSKKLATAVITNYSHLDAAIDQATRHREQLQQRINSLRFGLAGVLLLMLINLLGELHYARREYEGYPEEMKTEQPFITWWWKFNRLRLMLRLAIAGLIAVAISLGAEQWRALGLFFTPERLQGLAALVLLLSYLLFDLSRARRIFRDIYGAADNPLSFLFWWLRANLPLFWVTGVLLAPLVAVRLLNVTILRSFASIFTFDRLLLVGAPVALLGYLVLDLFRAHRIFRELFTGAEQPESFREWWLRANIPLFGATAAVMAALLTPLAAVRFHDVTILHSFARIFTFDRLLVAGTPLAIVGFVLLDLTLARRFFGVEKEAVSFTTWWLRRNLPRTGFAAMLLITIAGTALYRERLFLPAPKGDSARYIISARDYLSKQQYREAEIELRNAIRLHPTDAVAQLGLAQTLWHLGKTGEALAAARSAVEIAPAFYEANLVQGWLALDSGYLSEALTAARAARTLKPDEDSPAFLLARIYTLLKEYDLAAAQYRQILARNPDDTATRSQLISLFLIRQLYVEAHDETEAGLKAATNDTGLLLLQATALQLMSLYDQAIMALQAAAATNPASHLPHLAMGDLHTAQRDYHAATRSYEEVLTRSPGNARAMNNLANLIADHGFDLHRAATLAATLYRKAPHDPIAIDTLGWVLYRQGRLDQALPLLRRATAMSPDSPTEHYHLGAALIASGERREGCQELKRALKLSLTFAEAAQTRILLRSAARNRDA